MEFKTKAMRTASCPEDSKKLCLLSYQLPPLNSPEPINTIKVGEYSFKVPALSEIYLEKKLRLRM